MKKITTLILTVVMLFTVCVSAFAEGSNYVGTIDTDRLKVKDRYEALDKYCASEAFSVKGLACKFPAYYLKCRIAYAQDKMQIKRIETSLDTMLAAGRETAEHDVKGGKPQPGNGIALGTCGDILVSLKIDSGSFGFAGHAAIVSVDSRFTVESYAKSFSELKIDGVQIYENTWGNRHGSLLLRPYNATPEQFSTAAKFAKTKVGLPYNWNFFNKWSTSKYYCSQLVWQAWLAAGIDTEVGSLPNGIIAPSDLVNSSNTYLVEHIS